MLRKNSCFLILVITMLLSGCTTYPENADAPFDHARFTEEQKGYHDRLSSVQEADWDEHIQRSRMQHAGTK
ncbi:hypothetical protein [Synoicihabitans lomoniglobus]|uniref:Lipoprotein n=1 Tax=Synoicihabitans lomoniglobus TaxID=2909285 RepID=A0AAE9ZXP3_9BACT|nr:hypothetical protein [Opitutaceae bacterium LMO-M01]WED64840.1 hypothetical protein PXH66_21045 [Opitutaceae bacterium LMO-M01]